MAYTTSDLINKYIRLNNKNQSWMAELLNLTQPQIHNKLKKNKWEQWEIEYLKDLKII